MRPVETEHVDSFADLDVGFLDHLPIRIAHVARRRVVQDGQVSETGP